MFVPFMRRWYNRIIDQEVKDYERYLTEEAEQISMENIKKSKEQLEYYQIH